MTEDVAADRQEVVAAGSGDRCRVPMFMRRDVDRVQCCSRGEKNGGVAELQDLDVGERVGAVAAADGVRDRWSRR